MKRHLIAGKFGPKDQISIPKGNDEVLTELNLLGSDGKLNYGIGRVIDDLKKIGLFPSEIGIDLLVVAAHIQAADTHLLRSTESQDSWTREIRIFIPVSDLARWNQASSILNRTLNFLTGDLWTINFRQRPAKYSRIALIGLPGLINTSFDNISLFSGGLDSLIGAIDLLERGGHPLFVSHASDGSISDAQTKCFNEIKTFYKINDFNRLRAWISFSDVKKRGPDFEKSTRGRSFLFFALGIIAGSGFKKPFTLRVPENGLIALNIPLDPLRLGSHSTRTTHPFYIARWNELLKILGITGRIENPYWNRTKGEMVKACENRNLLERLVPLTLSCSSPTKGRWQGQGIQHCGYCLPCLIRRAAIIKGLGHDTTKYTLDDLEGQVLNTSRAEGQQVRSFQFAIQRLNMNPNLAKIIVHNSGSLSDVSNNQCELAGVYQRGMSEIAAILANVITRPL